MIKSIAKIFLVSALIVTISSCSRDSCKNVSCPAKISPTSGIQIAQQCVSGKCVCSDGYEGVYCDTLSATKYTGNYNVYENCYGTPSNFSPYTVYISPDPNYVNRIDISNLFNLGILTYAFIYTDVTNQGNTIQVPYQAAGGITFQGSGNYTPLTRTININFTYTFGGGSYQCTHTFYPQ